MGRKAYKDLEKRREAQKRFKDAHPTYMREWASSHRESCVKATRKWQKNNPEKYRLLKKKFIKNNPEYKKMWDRKNQKRLRYGITQEHYDELLLSQKGVCGLCGNSNKNGNNLSIDHDHETLVIRGLLCVRCNYLIGTIENMKVNLQDALNWIERGK